MKPLPENAYSKSDYHTPLQVATELGLDHDLVFKVMKRAYLRKATIRVITNNSTAPLVRPLVIISRYSDMGESTKYKLHPKGLDQIKILIEQEIQKNKDKGK